MHLALGGPPEGLILTPEHIQKLWAERSQHVQIKLLLTTPTSHKTEEIVMRNVVVLVQSLP